MPYPPPPFDCDFTRSERRSDDTDEDWLPDLNDILSGNVHVMIDLTGDLNRVVCYSLQGTRTTRSADFGGT